MVKTANLPLRRSVVRPLLAAPLFACAVWAAPVTSPAEEDANVTRQVAVFFRSPTRENYELCRSVILAGQGMDVLHASEGWLEGQEFRQRGRYGRRDDVAKVRWLLGAAGANWAVIDAARAMAKARTPGVVDATLIHFKYAENATRPTTYVPRQLLLDMYRSDEEWAGRVGKYVYNNDQPDLSGARDSVDAALEAIALYNWGIEKPEEWRRKRRTEAETTLETALAELRAGVQSLSRDLRNRTYIGWLHATRGELLSAWERWQEAAEAFSEATNLEPNLIEAYRLRAEVYRKLDEVAKAIQDEESARRLVSEEMMRWARGEIAEDEVRQVVRDHFRENKFGCQWENHLVCGEIVRWKPLEVLDECVRYLADPAFRASPLNTSSVASYLGDLLGKVGQNEALLALCQRLAEAGIGIGDVADDIHDHFGRSAEGCLAAGTYVPLSFYAYLALHGKDEADRELYSWALDRDERPFPRQLATLAVVAKQKGQTEVAEQKFTAACQALAAELSSASAGQGKQDRLVCLYVTRGELYATWGDWPAAVREYDKAIEADHGHIWAYKLRAQAHRALGRSQEAETDEAAAKRLLKAAISPCYRETVGEVSMQYQPEHDDAVSRRQALRRMGATADVASICLPETRCCGGLLNG